MDSIKIFFSTSTRFFEKNKVKYKKILEVLKDLNISITNNWIKNEKSFLSAKDFKKTMESLIASDAIIFEATIPSMSTGYQISYAVENKKPCLILIHNDKKFSTNHYVERHPLNYTNKNYISMQSYNQDNLKIILQKFLEEYVNPRANTRFNFVIPRYINNYLESQSLKNNMSKTELLKSLIKEDMIKTNEPN